MDKDWMLHYQNFPCKQIDKYHQHHRWSAMVFLHPVLCVDTTASASSRAVAAATAHLLAASRAKLPSDSPIQAKLATTAKAVAQAGSKLVVVAQLSKPEEVEEEFASMSSVVRKKAEIETAIKIREIEKRLEEERRSLGVLHAKKYR
eukprot:TRINITY_DN5133_c0_g4_i5.p1 TRINITY_DN5133_c0_g4~~TRINITY_DN5133_c0_g4_i5.p1  ORF type:complete len:147 (-),score=35.68 TRINITY_DN5133_c0_g4_i5:145-585(-)